MPKQKLYLLFLQGVIKSGDNSKQVEFEIENLDNDNISCTPRTPIEV